MAASLVVRRFPYMPVDQLIKEVDACAQQDVLDHGEFKDGFWTPGKGTTVSESPFFKSYVEAEDYIANASDSSQWGPLLAVTVIVASAASDLTPEEIQMDRALSDLSKSRDELHSLIAGQEKVIVDRAKAASSKFRSCKSCGSKMNAQFLYDLNCPLCRQPLLMTEVDEKKKQGWLERKVRIETKIDARKSFLIQKKSKRRTDAEKFWVVGGWIPC